ncbi:MAG: hypothetical protein M1830_008867 [Pleopsidium flavum]|nr:MAG: hypothetical protein M1830_009231 [Pleopsidium flavum]KAI9875113.1 MAG: hypothetical protein M1830_008867 [Pleopsidium flavum]
MSSEPSESSSLQRSESIYSQSSGHTGRNNPHQEPAPVHAESVPSVQSRNSTAEADDNRRVSSSSEPHSEPASVHVEPSPEAQPCNVTAETDESRGAPSSSEPHPEPAPVHAEPGPGVQSHNSTAEADENRGAPSSSQPNNPQPEPATVHAAPMPNAQPRNARARANNNRRAPSSSAANLRRRGASARVPISLPPSYRTYESRHDSLTSFSPRMNLSLQRPATLIRRDMSLLAFAVALVVLVKAVESGDVGVVVVVFAAMIALGLWMIDWIF